MQQNLFDYETAVERVGGSGNFSELASRFVEYCPERISRLHQAVRNGDVEQAGALANVLRGPLAVLSADRAHAAARELAICSSVQDVVAMRGAAEVLVDELRGLNVQLRRLLRKAA